MMDFDFLDIVGWVLIVGLCYVAIGNVWNIIYTILEFIQFMFFASIILCLVRVVVLYPPTMLLIWFVVKMWDGYENFGYHDMFVQY